MVRHLRADGPVLRQTVRLTQPDNPPMDKGVNLHTKQGKRRKGKAHMVGWSKLTLLLIGCSPRVLARRPFYVIGQRRNPSHLLKQNGQIKWLERRHNKYRLFILWDPGTLHMFTHRRYIILFKYRMVRWWIHGTCIVPLSIQTGGTSILFLLIHWLNGHGRERYNLKRPLYNGDLLNDLHIGKPVTYIRLSSYAFGSSTFTKRQGICWKPNWTDGPRVRRVS
jgi:hypothetical protein